MPGSPDNDTHDMVQKYYGETLESSEDLKTTACCTVAQTPDYIKQLLAEIHEEVASRYYGCGLVLPEALEGMHVLDLGCGAGRDVYLLSRLVGPSGRVTGVDMTPEQLAVARKHQQFHMTSYGYAEANVEFVEANIEALDETNLAEQGFDLIVSNCVINLAVDKEAVLRSAFRLLRQGGEMYFSDIYASRRVPQELTRDPVLYGECLAGALYWSDFCALARRCGFAEPVIVEDTPVDVTDPGLADRVGDLRFRSVTVRLFRAAGLEVGQENYGQCAVYKGGLAECPEAFRWARDLVFPVGAAVEISGNMASMLQQSRLAPFFDILGDDKCHLGAFSSISAGLSFPDELAPGSVSSCC